MSKIILDITISLDGFIAGPDISKTNPLGIDGPLLHNWLFKNKTNADEQLLNDLVENSGAVITGAHTYNTAIENAWGGKSPFIVPAFVLCSKDPQVKVDGFTFVKDGMDSALQKAKAVAGDKNIWVMGGGYTIHQFIKAKVFDELIIHMAPLLLKKGTRLFRQDDTPLTELIPTKVITTPAATHLFYSLKK
jgi:dihydrofolate reductase